MPNHLLDFSTLELLPYGVIVVNADGIVLFYNQREEAIAGRQREEVVGRNFFMDVAPCTRVQEFQGRFQELMREGQDSAEFHFVFHFARGPRNVQISLHPFEKDGEQLCVIFVADISERERVREAILQNQRFSELGTVAAMVAHNFNNLLGVIQASTELALSETSPRGQVQLNRILGVVGDGARLVSRFREISRSGTDLEQGRFDLLESVATAVEYASHYADKLKIVDGRQVALVVEREAVPLPVDGDAAEIREVLLNLLHNAIYAIPEKGTVTVATAASEGVAVVEITDDGTGMSLEVQQRLFTPMVTTKGDAGTGLGLASCHATLRRHGGTITVASAPGRGSRFRVELPLARP